MIESLRWPSATPSSTKCPMSSGPRCATEAVIRSMRPSSMRRPLASETQTIPHTSGPLGGDHGETAIFLVEPVDAKPPFGAPSADVRFSLTVRVVRAVPVEVHVDVRVERVFLVPEELREIPV